MRRLAFVLLVVVLCGLVGGVGFFLFRQSPLANMQYVRQLITADPAHSRTIMWESIDVVDAPYIEYGEVSKGTVEPGLMSPLKREAATYTMLEDGGMTRHLYTATLSHLRENTNYAYRIVVGRQHSEWKPFQTSGNGDFKALLFPDSQSNDYGDWERMVSIAYQKNPNAKFFVNMGDLVDNGEDGAQWNVWFNSVTPMIEKIPFVGVMGNHETYDLQWQVREPKAFSALFKFPTDETRGITKEGKPVNFYSFDYNDVHFVVLDTQFQEKKETDPDLMQAEIKWLESDLQRTTMKWKVILMHKDSFSYANTKRPNSQAGINDIGKAFMPIFDTYGVDLVLSGHYHTYRRRGHVSDFKRSNNGPLYILTGVAGNVRYDHLWKDHPLDEFVAPQPERDNYIVFEKIDDMISVRAFSYNGSEMDNIVLKK